MNHISNKIWIGIKQVSLSRAHLDFPGGLDLGFSITNQENSHLWQPDWDPREAWEI